jgi:hypothetical protein
MTDFVSVGRMVRTVAVCRCDPATMSELAPMLNTLTGDKRRAERLQLEVA